MTMQSGRGWSRRLGACLAALLLLAACGEPSPEAQLAEAREGLERARTEVASAKARYEETQRELQKAQQAREKAAEALEEAREQLEEARAQVGRFATDDAIFRAVQSALLADDKLSEVAIPVRVNDGVVVLTGEVPKPALSERAEELAAEVAGVVEVRNRIQVREPGGASKGSSGARSEPGEKGAGTSAPAEQRDRSASGPSAAEGSSGEQGSAQEE